MDLSGGWVGFGLAGQELERQRREQQPVEAASSYLHLTAKSPLWRRLLLSLFYNLQRSGVEWRLPCCCTPVSWDFELHSCCMLRPLHIFTSHPHPSKLASCSFEMSNHCELWNNEKPHEPVSVCVDVFCRQRNSSGQNIPSQFTDKHVFQAALEISPWRQAGGQCGHFPHYSWTRCHLSRIWPASKVFTCLKICPQFWFHYRQYKHLYGWNP